MNSSSLIDSFASWSEMVARLSWKGGCLALVAWLVLLAAGKRLSPGWRHAVWLLVLLRFVVPDLGAFRWSLSALVEAPVTVVEVEKSAERPVDAALGEKPDAEAISVVPATIQPISTEVAKEAKTVVSVPAWSWGQWLGLFWLSGMVSVFLAMLVLHLKWMRRVKKGRQVPSEAALAILRQACDLAGVKKVPVLAVSSICESPAIAGVLRPTIWLPAGLVESTDTASLRVILLHELAHLRRCDLWMQLVTSLIVAVHWFDPLVWLAAHRLRAEAEMAADEAAIQRSDDEAAHRLGEALLSFAARAPALWALWMTSSVWLGFSTGGRELRRRIEAITELAKGRRAWRVAGVAVFALLALAGMTRSADEKPVEVKTSTHASAITGRVTQNADGSPVAGASVYIGFERGSGSMMQPFIWHLRGIKTDENGYYKLPLSTSNKETMRIGDAKTLLRVDAPGMATFVTTLPEFKEGLTQAVQMEPKKSIQGTIVNAKGVAVEKALVWVVETDVRLPTIITSEYVIEEHTTFPNVRLMPNKWLTKSDGVFQLSEVHPMIKDKLWVFAMHATEGVARLPARDLKPGAQLKLSPWVKVTGRVTHPNGDVAVNTEIALAYNGNDHFSEPAVGNPPRKSYESPFGQFYRGSTDAEGRFEHPKVLPHSTLTVRVAGNATPAASVQIKEGGTQEVSVQTTGKETAASAAYRPVKGRLVFPKGYGFTSDRYRISASISRLKGGDGRLAMGPIKPDADGNFRTHELPPGIYAVVVMISSNDRSLTNAHLGTLDRATFRLEPVESRTPFDLGDIELTEKDFEFKPVKGPLLSLPVGAQGVAKLLVVDDTGAALAGARIVPHSLLTQARDMIQLENDVRKHAREVVTDASGRAQVSFDRDLPGGGKAAGVRCHVTTQEGASQFNSETLSEGPETRIVIPRAIQLDLEVANTDKPVSWSAVGSVVARIDDRAPENGHLRAAIAVKEDGLLLVQGIMADGAAHFSPVIKVKAKPGDELRERITLTPGVTVRGEVKGLPADYDGSGWATALVTAVRDVPTGKIERGNSPLNWSVWTSVARDGSFTFKGLPPGKLQLAATGDGWLTRSPNAQGCEWTGEIEDGKAALQVTFDIERCGEKRVRLLLPDGKPAAGAACTVSMLAGPASISRIWLRPHSIPMHFVRAEDAAAYATFGREKMPGHRGVADAEGWLTLRNQPSTGTYTNVMWTDPVTEETRRDFIKLEGPAKEHVVKLGQTR